MSEKKTRDWFYFDRAAFEAIERLPKDKQLSVYRAVCQSAFEGEVTEQLDDAAAAVYMLIDALRESEEWLHV